MMLWKQHARLEVHFGGSWSCSCAEIFSFPLCDLPEVHQFFSTYYGYNRFKVAELHFLPLGVSYTCSNAIIWCVAINLLLIGRGNFASVLSIFFRFSIKRKFSVVACQLLGGRDHKHLRWFNLSGRSRFLQKYALIVWSWTVSYFLATSGST